MTRRRPLSELAIEEPERFRELVGRMRKLGVMKLGALVLGPEPPRPAPVAERKEQERQTEHQKRLEKHRIMFAATTTHPPPPEVNENPANVPRMVSERAKANGKPA